MLGRGRGRGKGMTFDPRDMGFGAGEQLPGPVLQPPPTFPPLEHRPASSHTSPEMEYMVAVKKDLTIFLKDHWTQGDGLNSLIWETSFNWMRLPLELHPRKKAKSGKKRSAGPAPSRPKKVAFDLNTLDALEKLDENPDEPEAEKEGEKEKEDGDEEINEEGDLEEDLDEEMDDGTDYANHYFDNGEDTEDDDDNGNDGPIY